MTATLYYAHDPMCSWCWAFRPGWDHVCATLGGEIRITRLLGGLAPDSSEAMPRSMQEMLQDTWRHIQLRVPAAEFNFDFWKNCSPRRSTYPACRAVIAATRMGQDLHEPMTRAIQRAYYLEARNPSDDSTLVAIAEELGLDKERFSKALHSEEVRDEFQQHVALCHRLNIPGFPSLLVHKDGVIRRIPVEFNDPGLQVSLIADAAG